MAEVLAVMRSIPIVPPGGTAAGSGSLEHPQYTVELSKAEAVAALETSRKEVQGKRHDNAKITLQARNVAGALDVSSPTGSKASTSSAITTAIERGELGREEALSQRHPVVRGLRPADASGLYG